MVSTYSIRDLERLSGIKAHTLRIWEQRYGIIVPDRTNTNIRYYNGEQLKKVLNISVLNNNGYKISRIADLSDHEILNEVEKITNAFNKEADQIESLIIAMIDYDEERFEKIINKSILCFGLERTIEYIVFPFLHQVGILWQIGAVKPGQEHFITHLIRQKMIVAIDGVVPFKNENKQTILLFLPENEWHELSLLYYYYLCKVRGHECVYLGQSMPDNDLAEVIEARKPDCIISVLTVPFVKPKTYDKFLSNLSKGNYTILLSGKIAISNNKELPQNVKVFENPESLRNFI